MIALFVAKREDFCKPIFENSQYISVLILGLFLFGIFIYLLQLNLEPKKAEQENLFHKRGKDLKRILDYVENFNIIGIEGVWGNGKTFLVQNLKEQLKRESKEVSKKNMKL
jgi:hypothetical protein